MTRDEVFDAIVGMGAARAEANFSGGNDEGCVEGVVLYSQTGEVIKALKWEMSNGLVYRTAEGALYDAIGDPVWDKFGSFAGDFYTSGAVVWTVEDRKVIIKYSEPEWVDKEEVV